MCKFLDCKKRASFGFINGKSIFCKKHKEPNMINIKSAHDSKKCEFEGCIKVNPSFNISGNKGKFCNDHKLPGMINVVDKRCAENECKKICPVFDYIGGSGKYCATHKLKDMINVKLKSKKCNHIGCSKQGTFGIAENLEIYCLEHKDDNMIDIIHKICLNCNKRAYYGNSFGKLLYCKEHKKDTINLSVKKCKFIGCKTQPRFGINKATHCKSHKTDNMIDIYNKRCCEIDCTIINPVFNIIGGNGKYCKKHKKDNMINVKSKICNENNCTKQPSYDFIGGKGIYCKEHKKDNMIDIKHHKCNECDSRALYGKPGSKPSVCFIHRKKGMIKRSSFKCTLCDSPAIYGNYLTALHCEKHKLLNDINLVEMPCTSCGLVMILDKNNNCEYCNPEIFKKMQLVKQNELMSYLDAKDFKGYSTDKIVDNGICGKERPDRVFDFDDKIIILECDENQHKERNCLCEQTRMINISQTFGGLPVYFIRFNPDKYISSKIDKSIEDIKIRYNLLFDLLNSIKNNNIELPSALLSCIYLYYDNWDTFNNEEWVVITPFEGEGEEE